MKTCPYCGEEIQDKAIKCKHCGEWLDRMEIAKRRLHTVKKKFEEMKESVIPVITNKKKALNHSFFEKIHYGFFIVVSIVGFFLTFAGMSKWMEYDYSENSCDNTQYYEFDANEARRIEGYIYDVEPKMTRIALPRTFEEEQFYRECRVKEFGERSWVTLILPIALLPQLAFFLFFLWKFTDGLKWRVGIQRWEDSFSMQISLGRSEYLLSILILGLSFLLLEGRRLEDTIPLPTGYVITYGIYFVAYILLSIKRGKNLGNVSTGTTIFYLLFPIVNMVAVPIYLFGSAGCVQDEKFYSQKTKWIVIIWGFFQFLFIAISIGNATGLIICSIFYFVFILGLELSQRKSKRWYEEDSEKEIASDK